MKYQSDSVTNAVSKFWLSAANTARNWPNRPIESAERGAPAPLPLSILHPVVKAVKRSVDIFGALAGILLLTPVIFLASVLIRLDSPGPVLFSQWRVGKGGLPFRLWKFRTMVPPCNSEMGAQGFDLDRWPEWERYQKLRFDPRVTRIGRVLRRYSLDEIPQLWNVLVGEMSLVGPRPCFYNQTPLYGWKFNHYIQVRPGMTGLWQVSGRNNTTFEQRVELDSAYIVQWSPNMECAILWRTIWVVLQGEGAF